MNQAHSLSTLDTIRNLDQTTTRNTNESRVTTSAEGKASDTISFFEESFGLGVFAEGLDGTDDFVAGYEGKHGAAEAYTAAVHYITCGYGGCLKRRMEWS